MLNPRHRRVPIKDIPIFLNPERKAPIKESRRYIANTWIEFYKRMQSLEGCCPNRIIMDKENNIEYLFFFDVFDKNGEFLTENIQESRGSAKAAVYFLQKENPAIRFKLTDENEKNINGVTASYTAETGEEKENIRKYLEKETKPKDIKKIKDITFFIYKVK